MTKSSIEETLVEVWRQALVENTKAVKVGAESYPVRRTPKRGLRQVDFIFDGNEIRGLEQNADTKSRWAQLARSGKKVIQFLSEGRYVANVVDGNVTRYHDTLFLGLTLRTRLRMILRKAKVEDSLSNHLRPTFGGSHGENVAKHPPSLPDSCHTSLRSWRSA